MIISLGNIGCPIKYAEEFNIRPESLHLPCQLAIQRESFAFQKQKAFSSAVTSRFREVTSRPQIHHTGSAGCRRRDKGDVLPTQARLLPGALR